jgi:hypothetical protein
MSNDIVAKPNGVTAGAEAKPVTARRDDAIYQNDRPAGRTLDVQVDLGAKEIRFGEIYQSDYLLLPDECEYQKYRILVQKVAFAGKLDRSAAHKGRVLRGVVAEILGYREQ